jgi:hypothetical protein
VSFRVKRLHPEPWKNFEEFTPERYVKFLQRVRRAGIESILESARIGHEQPRNYDIERLRRKIEQEPHNPDQFDFDI